VLRKLICKIIAAILGLWLAQRFVPGVKFYGSLELFLLCAIILGVINFFVKPLLNKISLPLRILTLGLFGLVIDMGILWFLDVAFPELAIKGIIPLFLTTCIILILDIFF